jgi:hypothetical protein
MKSMVRNIIAGFLVFGIFACMGCQLRQAGIVGKWSYASDIANEPIFFNFEADGNLKISLSDQNSPTTARMNYSFSGTYRVESGSLTIQLEVPDSEDYMGGLAHSVLGLVVPKYVFDSPGPKIEISGSDQLVLTSAAGEKVLMGKMK